MLGALLALLLQGAPTPRPPVDRVIATHLELAGLELPERYVVVPGHRDRAWPLGPRYCVAEARDGSPETRAHALLHCALWRDLGDPLHSRSHWRTTLHGLARTLRAIFDGRL